MYISMFCVGSTAGSRVELVLLFSIADTRANFLAAVEGGEANSSISCLVHNLKSRLIVLDWR